jgi:aspartate aminotransferase-like enzyme
MLSERGVVIYPGKLSDEKVFRIGNIGDISFETLDGCLNIIQDVTTKL